MIHMSWNAICCKFDIICWLSSILFFFWATINFATESLRFKTFDVIGYCSHRILWFFKIFMCMQSSKWKQSFSFWNDIKSGERTRLIRPLVYKKHILFCLIKKCLQYNLKEVFVLEYHHKIIAFLCSLIDFSLLMIIK